MKLEKTIIIIFCTLGFFSSTLTAQKEGWHDCSMHTQDEAYQAYLDDLPAIRTFIDQHYQDRSDDTTYIPVYFHVFRENNGNFNALINPDQALIDSALVQLNTYFADANFVFFQLGDINFIDQSQLSSSYASYSNKISYVSTALNIYTSSAINSSQAQTPNFCYNTPGIVDSSEWDQPSPVTCNNNSIYLKSRGFTNTSMAHEIGHTYGLLHTFAGSSIYNNPSDPTPGWQGGFLDHPYDGYSGRRELSLQEVDDTKAFPLPNKDISGDLVGDTPAFCLPNANYFPTGDNDNCESFPFSSSCNGCIVAVTNNNECIYIGNYTDYNGDQLVDPQVGVKNIMSYTGQCREEFTEGQIQRMHFYNATVRSQQFDAAIDINYNERIELAGTDQGLSNVVVRWNHPDDHRHSNSISAQDGSVQGILYAAQVMPEIERFGSQPGASSILPIRDSYSAQEWREGIDIKDVVDIIKHKMGIVSLDGYGQIAADANKDGMITTEDYQTVYDIVSGQVDNFQVHETPWHFIPEYIVHDYADDFHENPFNLTINDHLYINYAPYLEEGWSFEFTPLHDSLGLRGFDGVKIGDVNTTMEHLFAPEGLVCGTPNTELTINGTKALAAGEETSLTFRLSDAASISAFQMGWSINEDFVTVEEWDFSDKLDDFDSDRHLHVGKTGEYRVAYYNASLSEIAFDREENIFSLRIRAKQDINDLFAHLELDQDMLPTRFYGDDDCPLDLKLNANALPKPQWHTNSTNSHTLNNQTRLHISPNPTVNGQAQLRFSSPREEAQAFIVVRDFLGRDLLQSTTPLEEGINQFDLDLSAFHGQVVLVTLTTSTGEITERVVCW